MRVRPNIGSRTCYKPLVSFKPDQVRSADGPRVRGTVFDQPLAPFPGRAGMDPAGRARDRYRRSRSRERRPLWPETRNGWALLGGVSAILVVVLVAIVVMPPRANPVLAPGNPGGSGGTGTAQTANLAAASAGASGFTAAPPTDTSTPEPPHDPIVPPVTLTGYRWPLATPAVTLPFGPSSWGDFFYNGVRIHDGVDMASWCGDNVLAAHDGTVLAVNTQYDDYLGWVESLQPYKDLFNRKKWWSSLPLTVVIDDGNGFRSIYAHEYKITVKVGQKVKAGQVIGYEGQTGNASGCHVHFGLFDPNETATFELDPGIVSRDLLPEHELARVNPLYVLPFRCDIEEMRPLYPDKAATCPALPSPSPSPKKK